MMTLLFILLLLGALVALPFVLRYAWQERTRRVWLELAPRLELSLVTGDGRWLVTGRYHGHTLDVLLSPNGTAQLRMKTRAALPAGLHLSRQEHGTERLRLRGLQDIQIGEPALDAAFIVQGKNPAAVIRLLREPGVGEALLALQTHSPRAMITEGELVAPIESPVEEESCRRALRALARVTSTLEQVAGPRDEPPALPPARFQPDPPATPAPVQPAPPVSVTPRSRESERATRDAAIRDEFAQRMSLFSLITLYPGVAGVALLLLGKLLRRELFGLAPFTWTLLGMGTLLVGLVGALYSDSTLLSCPACERALTKYTEEQRRRRPELRTRHGRPSVWSLVACPHCGVRLR